MSVGEEVLKDRFGEESLMMDRWNGIGDSILEIIFEVDHNIFFVSGFKVRFLFFLEFIQTLNKFTKETKKFDFFFVLLESFH